MHPALLIGSTGVVLMLALFPLIKPIRSRVRFIQIIFSAMDRPEDRPHTLFWLSTQVVVGYLVLIPLILIFGQYGMSQLMLIPVFINGIGDRLAERWVFVSASTAIKPVHCLARNIMNAHLRAVHAYSWQVS